MQNSINIFTHKTDTMRRLQHLVAHGYVYWTSGTIAPKKLEALTLKFSDRYAIQRTDMQRYRAKKKQEANSHLVLFCADTKTLPDLYWWLLATPGEGLIHQLETLKNATEKAQRITWPEQDDYELVKMPRKDSKAAWTWRMTSGCFEAWQERLRSAVRRNNDDQLRQALYSLRRVPGFREARKQAFQLEHFAKADWQRCQRGEWPYPGLFVGFQGRYKTPETIPLSELVAKTKRKKRTPPRS